jgi:hypothetical protein
VSGRRGARLHHELDVVGIHRRHGRAHLTEAPHARLPPAVRRLAFEGHHERGSLHRDVHHDAIVVLPHHNARALVRRFSDLNARALMRQLSVAGVVGWKRGRGAARLIVV